MSSQGAGERDLPERLRQLRVDPPAGDFSAALHRRLAAAGPPDAPGAWERLKLQAALHPRWGWALVGATAAAVLFASTALLHLPRGVEGAEAAVLVPRSKVAVVRVDFATDVEVQDADIRVSPPEGLVFWADDQALSQRTFEWTQTLTAGVNEIPIAVRGERPGRYRVTIRAQVGGQQIDHDVQLEVTDG